MHCVDINDGKRIWIFRTRDAIDSSPVICNDRVVACSMDGYIYIVDLETGKKIWSYEIGAEIIGSPAVIQNKILIGAEDGRLYCFGVNQ